MKTGTNWGVEDTFFGAILGAVLGVFVDKIPIQYITLIIFFFILFPKVLKKSESFSKYSLGASVMLSIIWMLLLTYDLVTQGIISFEESLLFLMIFAGWLVSLFTRLISK